MEKRELQHGDLVQIDPAHDPVFGGCIMMVTDPKAFGAMGFFRIPHHDGPGNAFYRCDFENMEFVGRAEWIPEPHGSED